MWKRLLNRFKSIGEYLLLMLGSVIMGGFFYKAIELFIHWLSGI